MTVTEVSNDRDQLQALIGKILDELTYVPFDETVRVESKYTARVEKLAHKYEKLSRNAADPLEIAAQLEADGISDVRARREYGVSDVFELSQQLFDLAPKPTFDDEPGSSEVNGWLEYFVRGVLYALPGLLTIVAMPRFGLQVSTLMMMIALTYSWALGHAGSYIAYFNLWSYGWSAAKRVLQVSVFGSTLLWLCASPLISTLLNTPGWSTVVSDILVIYFFAANGLHILGKDRHLLGICAALTVGVALALFTNLAVGSAFLGLTIFFCLAYFARVSRIGTVRSPRVVVKAALHGATLRFLYGTACGSVVAVATISWQAYATSLHQFRTDLVAIPLIVGFGTAEWEAHEFRKRVSIAVRKTNSFVEFKKYLRLQVTRSTMRFVGSLVALSAPTAAVLAWRGHLTEVDLIRFTLFALVGGICFVGLLLVQYNHEGRMLALFFPLVGLSVITYWRADALTLSGTQTFSLLVLCAISQLTAMILIARISLPILLDHR